MPPHPRPSGPRPSRLGQGCPRPRTRFPAQGCAMSLDRLRVLRARGRGLDGPLELLEGVLDLLLRVAEQLGDEVARDAGRRVVLEAHLDAGRLTVIVEAD